MKSDPIGWVILNPTKNEACKTGGWSAKASRKLYTTESRANAALKMSSLSDNCRVKPVYLDASAIIFVENPTGTEVLNVPMDPERNGPGCTSIGDYLTTLLTLLVTEEDSFSSKRPFGNSDWKYELYDALVLAGMTKGEIDEDEDTGERYVDGIDDTTHANSLINIALKELYDRSK